MSFAGKDRRMHGQAGKGVSMPSNGGGNGQRDVIDLADHARKKIRSTFGGGGGRLLWIIAVVIGVLIAGYTAYYQIEPDEVGIVTRFGAYVRKTQPGAHFKIPFGIEKVVKVPVQRQLKQEFGFRTVHANVRTKYARPREAKHEAIMLTGDLNVADVQWIIQYRIANPYNYVFKVRDVKETLRDMSEAAMRQVVGDSSVNEVLTIGRERIQVDSKKRLQELCRHYGTGIAVEQLVLQDVNPPDPVRPSFNKVNEANQVRERLINEARAQYNRVIPEARGKAKQRIQTAKGYAAKRINHAKGDTKRFLALQAEYARAPSVTRTRLHLEALGEVLPKTKARVIVDGELKGLLPMLSLNRGAALGGGR